MKDPLEQELEALCARHGLDGAQRAQLEALLEGLAHDEHAPTTVREPARAVGVHLADSLAGLELEALRKARLIVDVGAGAGFPGLPLAIALEGAEVRLLESQVRKWRFLEAQIGRARVRNARSVWARAEEWPEGMGAHDAALARAVGPPPLVLEYAAPLLREGGALIDWRGRRDPAEEELAERVARVLGLKRLEIRRVEPFTGAEERHLHLYLKVAETPSEFPRRAGMARKRPLSG